MHREHFSNLKRLHKSHAPNGLHFAAGNRNKINLANHRPEQGSQGSCTNGACENHRHRRGWALDNFQNGGQKFANIAFAAPIEATAPFDPVPFGLMSQTQEMLFHDTPPICKAQRRA